MFYILMIFLCIYFEKYVNIFNHKEICVVEDSWNLSWNRLKSQPLPSSLPKEQFNSCGWVPGWGCWYYKQLEPRCLTLLWCKWNWFRWKYLTRKCILSLFKYSSVFFLVIDKNLLRVLWMCFTSHLSILFRPIPFISTELLQYLTRRGVDLGFRVCWGCHVFLFPKVNQLACFLHADDI